MRRVGTLAGDARTREQVGAFAMGGDERAKGGTPAPSFVPSCGTSVVPGWEDVAGLPDERGAGPAVLTTSEQMASSMIGAILTSLMVTPFDVVKTRLQHQASELAGASQMCGQCGKRFYMLRNGLMEHVFCQEVGVAPMECTPAARFHGTTDAFSKIWRTEGATALWRGLPPTLIMAVPQTMIYFTAYDQLKLKLGDTNPYYAPLVAGPIARTFAVSIISPLEMLRTKMQAESVTHSARDYAVLLSDAVKVDGMSSLWRGLGATLLRDVPFSAIYWMGYEILKPKLVPWFNRPGAPSPDVPPIAASFVAGATSGSFAAALTLPFDVVKTRQQTTLGETLIGFRGSAAPGVVDIMRDIVRSQGISGLFVGFLPRIAKVAPACAIMISTYEASKGFFAARRKQSHIV